MPSRRHFLKHTSLASAGLLFSKADWLRASAPLIGLQLYTLRNIMGKDVPGTLAQVAQIGYSSVELYNYNKGQFFGLSPEQFLALIKQNNLKTPSGHYGVNNFLVNGEEEELKRTVADAAKMEHQFFVIAFLLPNMRTSLDDYKKLAAKLNRAGQLVKAAGMQLAYHNHNFEFLDWGGGQTGFGVFAKETDPSLVSFEMDFYWVTRAGMDPIKLIQENAHRIKLWHLKDMSSAQAPTFTTDGPQFFTEVGSGIINYKEIVKHKQQSGMQFFYVEQDQTQMPVFDSITKSFKYVQQNLVSGLQPAMV
jgi:sugar phosphate isomerase/epimerase